MPEVDVTMEKLVELLPPRIWYLRRTARTCGAAGHTVSCSRPARRPRTFAKAMGTGEQLFAVGLDAGALISNEMLDGLRNTAVTRIFVDPAIDPASGDVFGAISDSRRCSSRPEARRALRCQNRETMRRVALVPKPEPEVERVILYDGGDGSFLFLSKSTDDAGCFADEWYKWGPEATMSCRKRFGIEDAMWKDVPGSGTRYQEDWIAPVRVRGRVEGKPEWGVLERRVNGRWITIVAQTARACTSPQGCATPQ